MTLQRRKHKRVDVNLPIYCKFTNLSHARIVSAAGKVANLSVGGMKVKLPIKVEDSTTKIMDYFLVLPRPYQEIRGKARIVWTYWDDQTKTTEFGMELSSLNQLQQSDLEIILSELSAENYLEQ